MEPIKSQRVYRFVEEYAKDRNGTQAAIRSGYAVGSAAEQACALLRDPRVQVLIAEQSAKISKAVEFEAADVLREWIAIATADASKISKVRALNCRHCWGVGFAYRWKTREYAEACDRAAAVVDKKGNPAPKPPPNCEGGFGFRRTDDPNPDCPECEGEGVEDIRFADMDTLAAPERKLIAGVERTKDGLKVKFRDQDGAVANLSKYLGMLVEKRELTGKNGGPIVTAEIPPELAGDAAALAALYGKLVG